MRHELIVTDDGSHTVLDNDLNVTFHSRHGAIQESRHVFIEEGLEKVHFPIQELCILEIGFGTGLNALLASLWARNNHQLVSYKGYELYPLPPDIYLALNYPELLNIPFGEFSRLHECTWNEPHLIDPFFKLEKRKAHFSNISTEQRQHIIFLDAFAPSSQSQFWERSFLEILHDSLFNGGIIITYCAKGSFKRTLRDVGFTVESPSGPPGKREITRATKRS